MWWHLLIVACVGLFVAAVLLGCFFAEGLGDDD